METINCTSMIVPKELKTNFNNGCYRTHGRCLIKMAKTKQWRKATMHGRPFYEQYDFEIEPCDEFPKGGMHRLSTDHRWNDEDVRDIRLVPDEMWGLPIQQEKLTEGEILAMNLKNRLESGEKIAGEDEKVRANDWKILRVGNDSKYGRIAYSPSLNIMRTLTFNEFYGDGIVD